MRTARSRALALLLGAGVLLTAVPAQAGAARGRDEAAAVALLAGAAQAAAERPWSGTQYVASWRGQEQRAAVLEVEHVPGVGSRVSAAGEDDPVTATPELDPRLLRLLADSYDLAPAGGARSAGRDAHVVEARRRGGPVAGRFWLDRETGLLLRREVYDGAGARLRSSAFVQLDVGEPSSTVVSLSAPAGQRVDPDEGLPGWTPPRVLPGGLELYDARRTDDGVLHLGYSDGLSTLSVFAQRGALTGDPAPGFRTEQVAGTRVWVRPDAAERLVWEGDGRVFTLVSDAAPDTVRDAVRVLPHAARPDGGWTAALGRALRRAAGWLNPFD